MLIIILATLITICGVILDTAVLSALGTAILLVQCIRTADDLKALFGMLSDLLSNQQPASLQADRKNLPHTAWGRACREKLFAHAYRLSAMKWQVDSLTLPKTLGVHVSINAETLSSGNELSYNELYRQILLKTTSRFRAKIFGIVWNDHTSGAATEAILIGDTTQQFRAELLHYVSPYFMSADKSVLGVRATSISNSLIVDFSRVGLQYILTHPFQWSSELGTKQIGIIFLGYEVPFPPTTLEMSAVEDLAHEIEQNVPALVKMHSLSGRAAEAESAAKEKSEFLAHMSHDIRSPLNNIRVALHLIREEMKDAKFQEILQTAEINCNNMNELLETILDYSRHRVGKLTAHPESVDVGTELKSIAESFALSLKTKRIRLSLDLQSRSFVIADRKQLKRVLTNLISNAIKFTEPGGSIAVVFGDSSLKSAYIEIRDTGRGMSEAQAQRLFQPFTRLHPGVEGIGLGLALSKVLIELNNGKISVESKQNEGSVFTINIPKGEECIPTGTLRLIKGAKRTASQAHSVLIVDDDVDCIESLARIFEKEGISVMRAHSVSEAISLVNYENPSAIVSDVCMPGGGAKELLRFLKKRAVNSPVLILSGENDALLLQDLRNLGASEVLAKPAEINSVVNWISKTHNSSHYNELSQTVNSPFC